MQPTRQMFQILLIGENQTTASRWFPNEQQAQYYCSEFNRIVDQERQSKARATYQPVEIRNNRVSNRFN